MSNSKEMNIAGTGESTPWLNQIIHRFEDAWESGQPPAIQDFLPAEPAERRGALVELVHVDLERRYRLGQSVRVESYLEEFPDLVNDQPAVLNLICREYQLRRRGETGLAPDECLARFPQYAEELVWRLPVSGSQETQDECPGSQVFEEQAGPGAPQSANNPRQSVAAPVEAWPHFPGYEILGELGQGGMGQVYRARDKGLNCLVALKVLRKDFAHRPDAAARFQREMQAVGQLENDHIVEARHAGEHEGQPFLVMKLLDGMDLKQVVHKVGPLIPADACEIVRQAALGLQCIHEHGLVHRDLKPSNLLLTSQGVVKILDLGLARLVHDSNEVKLTLAGYLGTVDYMAPEQRDQPSTVTIAADIYSLGCVLFHLLAGWPPFECRLGVLDKLAAHEKEPPPDLRTLRPELPEALVRLVERMLAKASEKRPAQPREVAETLAPLAAGADLAGLLKKTREEAVTPTPIPLPTQRRRRWWPLWLVVAVAIPVALIPVVVGAWWYFFGDGVAPLPLPTPQSAVAPLTVRSFRVIHVAAKGEHVEHLSVIGENSFGARFNDQVRVSVELSEPAYLLLRALNANGREQPFWPENDKIAPRPVQVLEYPSGRKAFTLDDEPRGGLHAFVLVASRQTLPPYSTWRQGKPALAWERLPPGEQTVWLGDGVDIWPVLPAGNLRGTVEEIRGLAPLAETAAQLRAVEGVEALRVLAFPVQPVGRP